MERFCILEDCPSILLLLWTYFLTLPLALLTFPLTNTVCHLSFFLSVLWTPGNQAIFCHINNSCATNHLPYLSSLMPFLFSLLSAFLGNSYWSLLSISHTQLPFSFLPRVFFQPHIKCFISLFFLFLLIFLAQPINHRVIYL